jgi:hypothetical protein
MWRPARNGDLIAPLFHDDVTASKVLEGWLREMTPREVRQVLELTKSEYEEAVRRTEGVE